VLAWFPDITIGIDQKHRHRQAETTQRFRKTHEVGDNAGAFEGKERSCPSASSLDVVNDQKRPERSTDLSELAKPGSGSDIQSAFALNRLHDNGGRLIDTARWIARHLMKAFQLRHAGAVVAVIRQANDALQAGFDRTASRP
jgi:hypothetical protein